ncbi:hypothetical protein DPMN_007098 [Dreissena polymorpha]|uniref:Uncharacterized protein n=1 Tax=Dreissena polymorpha TaxID=45954 RepID=A0A9D4MVJ8_DREPO|nr:hypothetical protein DPMN_007098 [Dreissena polymorpha]
MVLQRDAPGLLMGPCLVEIDCIVRREVQYQLEVNLCRNEEIIVKGNFGWVWPMWVGRPRIDRMVIREVQYQLKVNWFTNEEIIVKGYCGQGAPGLVMVPCIAEIDCIVIRECRNEKIIVKGNFGCVWPMWSGPPRIDRMVIREVQYQYEVNQCRNEEVNFQGSSANSMDGRKTEINTISPLFL